jgi:hypothetical protein
VESSAVDSLDQTGEGDDQENAQKPLAGLQGQSGHGGDPWGQGPGGTGPALRRASQSDPGLEAAFDVAGGTVVRARQRSCRPEHDGLHRHSDAGAVLLDLHSHYDTADDNDVSSVDLIVA